MGGTSDGLRALGLLVKVRVLFSFLVAVPGAVWAAAIPTSWIVHLLEPVVLALARLTDFSMTADEAPMWAGLAWWVLLAGAPVAGALFGSRLVAEAQGVHFAAILLAYWTGVAIEPLAEIVLFREVVLAPDLAPAAARWLLGPYAPTWLATHVESVRWG